MAGLYFHIPFCKRVCAYCDFYKSVDLRRMDPLLESMHRELDARREYLGGEPVRTRYFGGGTPSLCAPEAIAGPLDHAATLFDCTAAEETTLEANPDDLTEDYVTMLRRLPFNRISMGIQTFDDSTLLLLNRRHNALQAIEAVGRCRRHGFHNISIDLIYGLPGETDERWERDLRQAIALGVEHISAYHLTYEEGTPLHQMLQAHRVNEVDEDSSVRFFTTLMDTLSAAGYEHYEISNFCKPGLHSRHNTSYWQGIPYLGCGPSAHSFDGHSREWNIASLEKYISAIGEKKRSYEKEELSLTTCYNEYIMTSLRTRRGIDLPTLTTRFGQTLSDYCTSMAVPYLKSGKLEQQDNRLRLTRKGIFVSDGIISDLMFVEE